MPEKDLFCNSYLNVFKVQATNLKGDTHECTSVENLSVYKESDCGGVHASIIDVTMDLTDLKHQIGEYFCHSPIFTLSSIGVMAECTCEETSMDSSLFPSNLNLEP